MKRVFSFVGVLGTVLLFSCTKNSVSTQPSANKAVTSLENLDPNQYLLRFGGDFEPVQGTKVLTDPETGAQVFESGDEVRVYVPATSMEGLYVYDDVEDFFKPKDSEHAVAVGANTAYVYYPAGSFQIKDGQVTFTMSSSVEELPGLKTPLAGIIPAGARLAENPVVTFKNLGSVLHFSFDSEHADGETITGLTLSCTGAALAGSGLVTWSGDTVESEPQLQALNGASTVEVALAEPRHLEAGAPAHAYFFLPATGECRDLKVTAVYGKKAGGTTYAPSESFVRADSLVLSRGKLITVEKALSGFFGGGDGSAEHPYLIASVDDFKAIAPLANATSAAGGNGYDAEAGRTFFGSEGVHYQQTANLDFEGENINNYMISTPDISFQGTYSGQVGDSQYSLSNFKLEREPSAGDTDGTALFKNIENATLTGISIVGADVSGGKFTAALVGRAGGAGTYIQDCSIASSTISDSGHDYGAGGLVGGIYGGTVSGCSGTDLTLSTSVENKQYFGGLIIYINGTVTVSGCSLNGTTTVTNAQKFGGIIGQINNANATITNCHNHSTINGSKNYNGGICGVASKGTISNCTNDGAVNGLSSTAGIVAQLDGATVDHCTNSGTIHGSENYAAGIVAYHTKGDLTNSVNTGAISAAGAYVGGIAGMLKSSANYGLIKGCRSNASVTGSNDVAGIVGRVTWGIVMDCFAKGSATGGLNTGGIVGYAYSTDGNVAVLNCLANVAVTCNASGNQHSGGVIGRATCVDDKYVYIGNCAGLNNVVKATESNAVRFGAFTGFTNAEKKSGSVTPNRVRIWNSYTLVSDANFQCANTEATADVGGFVGRMGAASDLGDCYYINDGSKSTLNGSTYKNITKTTAAVIGGTGNIAVDPTRQGLSLDDTFLNVLNRCTYASNGTTRLTAFTNYPMCDWTMTGAGGEALSHPVQTSLVALGAEFYE